MLVEAPPSDGAKTRAVEDAAPMYGYARAQLLLLRSILKGTSPIDAARLWLTTRDDVDSFLRLNEFDTDNPLDLQRMRELHREATVYLTETLRYRLPKKIEQPPEIHDLFLWATSGGRRVQRFACMCLKVMHILHHLNGRQLVYRTAIAEEKLFERLNAKVFGVIDRMRGAGVAVQEFASGHKSRSSMVTKLLSKRNVAATHIFDKMRFRIIVEKREDVIHAALYLANHLFPFNYVVPEQSHNTILSAADIAGVLGLSPGEVEGQWKNTEVEEELLEPQNEFSGSTYRSINVVVDIPLRIDDLAPASAPAIAFAQAEIQLLDVATDNENNAGDNAHPLYKRRQRGRVRHRLEGPGKRIKLQDPSEEEELT